MEGLNPEEQKKKKNNGVGKPYKEINLDDIVDKNLRDFDVKSSKVEKEIVPYERFKPGSFNYDRKIDLRDVGVRTSRVIANDKDVSLVVAKNMEEVKQLQAAVEFKLASENTSGFKKFLLNMKYRIPVIKKLSKQYSITELLLAQADIMDKNVALLKGAVRDYLGLIENLEVYERELSSRSLDIADYITTLQKHKQKYLKAFKEHQSKKDISKDLSYREKWVLAQKYLLRDLKEIDKEIRKAIHYRALWAKQSSAIDINIKHMQLYGEFSEHIAITGEEASNYLRVTAGIYESSANMGDLNVNIGTRLMNWSNIAYKLGEAGAKRLYASVELVKAMNSADDNSKSNLEKLLTSSTREVDEVLNAMKSNDQDAVEEYLRQAESTIYLPGNEPLIDVGDKNIGNDKEEIYRSFGIDLE